MSRAETWAICFAGTERMRERYSLFQKSSKKHAFEAAVHTSRADWCDDDRARVRVAPHRLRGGGRTAAAARVRQRGPCDGALATRPAAAALRN